MQVFAFNDGSAGGSYVIMEFLPFSGRADPELFGRCMAKMHAAEPLAPEAKDGKFGFAVDNTIGDTPQPNGRLVVNSTNALCEAFGTVSFLLSEDSVTSLLRSYMLFASPNLRMNAQILEGSLLHARSRPYRS